MYNLGETKVSFLYPPCISVPGSAIFKRVKIRHLIANSVRIMRPFTQAGR